MTKNQSISILKVNKVKTQPKEDFLTVERPLSILLDVENEGVSQLSITMRTPGDDKALALGFMFNEGLIKSYKEVIETKKLGEDEMMIKIGSESQLNRNISKRNFISNSGCGVCGKSSVDEAMQVNYEPITSSKLTVKKEVLFTLESTMRKYQDDFNHTGGGHAVGLFDTDGNIIKVCEDVGRHNALDKIIGHQFMEGNLPLNENIILLSGRVGYELVQKSLMSGSPLLVSIGTPSSISFEIAKKNNLTLVGFLKGSSFNIYTGKERII